MSILSLRSQTMHALRVLFFLHNSPGLKSFQYARLLIYIFLKMSWKELLIQFIFYQDKTTVCRAIKAKLNHNETKTILIANKNGSIKYYLKDKECFPDNEILNYQKACFVKKIKRGRFSKSIIEISEQKTTTVILFKHGFNCIQGTKLFPNGHLAKVCNASRLPNRHLLGNKTEKVFYANESGNIEYYVAKNEEVIKYKTGNIFKSSHKLCPVKELNDTLSKSTIAEYDNSSHKK